MIHSANLDPVIFVERASIDKRAMLQDFLKSHRTVHHVRFHVSDYCNVHKTRFVTATRCLEMASNDQETTGMTTWGGILCVKDSLGGFSREILGVHSAHWVPDWSTIRLCAVDDQSQATVMCSIKDPGEQDSRQTYALDPRTILSKVQQHAKETCNIEFLVGHEIEFTLLPDRLADEPPSGVVGDPHSNRIRTPMMQVLLDSVNHLEANGVGVWTYAPEHTHGVFEIALRPQTPSVAADNLAYAIDVIHDIAYKHGYWMTIHPKPFENGDQVGLHTHLSISKPELGPHFLAGVLARYRELCSFLLGGYDSYSRHTEATTGYPVSYSYSKSAAIREVAHGYWEIRTPDGLSNPAIQLAALISAGIGGIEQGLPLTQKPSEWVQRVRMPEHLREEYGVTQDVPKSLEEALGELKREQEWWKARLGDKCIHNWITMRESLVKMGDGMTQKERRLALVQRLRIRADRRRP